MAVRVGVISDTHGLLRSEAKEHLRRCQQIIHAGDITDPQVLRELELLAPTTAVRGNMDLGSWASRLPRIARLDIGGWSILVVHNIRALPQQLEGVDIVIFGHSHKYQQERRNGILYLNPGSAGPRRFDLPISLAILSLGQEAVVEQILLKEKA